MPPANTLTRKTILLKGEFNEKYDEIRAGGTIKPGHLIVRNASGVAVVHATNGGYAEKIFAHEDALIGRTIDDAYSSGELVRYHVAQPGDVIYGFIKAGANVTDGSLLVSNADGTMDIVAGSEVPLAQSIEDVDNSGGGAAVRCAFRIL